MAEPPPGAAAQASGPGPDALPLCDGRALEERGRAWVWDVLEAGQPVRAFALRFDGRVHAYLNRCVHVAAELDWQPGEFLDAERRWILCSIHGAAYEPTSGRCVGGPCGRGRLQAIAVAEIGTQVYWYPSAAIRAAADAVMQAVDAGRWCRPVSPPSMPVAEPLESPPLNPLDGPATRGGPPQR